MLLAELETKTTIWQNVAAGCRNAITSHFLPRMVCIGSGRPFGWGRSNIWFYAVNAANIASEQDFRYFLQLYVYIGGFTGFAAGYFAGLVAGRRASWPTIMLLLLPAYLFVTNPALGKNPMVAVLATIVVIFILLMMVLANRAIRSHRSA